MSDSFREDWPKSGWLLGSILGLGIIGVLIILLFVQATPLPKLGNVPDLCSDDPAQIERARMLIQQGLDNALVDHAQHLLSVWIRDNVNESTRAATGISNGVRAYFHGHRQIEAWVIPPCKP